MSKVKKILGKILRGLGFFNFFISVIMFFAIFQGESSSSWQTFLLLTGFYLLVGLLLIFLSRYLLYSKKEREDRKYSNASYHSGGKTISSSTHPKRMTREQREQQKQRQKELQKLHEEHLRLSEEKHLADLAARQEYLAPWKTTNPEVIENTEKWQYELDHHYKLEWTTLHSAQGDWSLDGTHDETGVDWFILDEQANLFSFIYFYSGIDSYRKSCEANGIPTKEVSRYPLRALLSRLHDRRFFIIHESQWRALSENSDSVVRARIMCPTHDMHLVLPLPDNRYMDVVENCIYEAYIAEDYWGQVDDAAHYGNIGLRVVSDASSSDPDPSPNSDLDSANSHEMSEESF